MNEWLVIFRLHKLGMEAHAYAHYTSSFCFALTCRPTSSTWKQKFKILRLRIKVCSIDHLNQMRMQVSWWLRNHSHAEHIFTNKLAFMRDVDFFSTEYSYWRWWSRLPLAASNDVIVNDYSSVTSRTRSHDNNGLGTALSGLFLWVGRVAASEVAKHGLRSWRYMQI